MNFSERPLIITDFETTGLDPKFHDIIEIGAIKVDQEHLLEISRFAGKVQIQNPDTVTEEALTVNGYTSSDWVGALTIAAAMRLFTEYSKDGVLAAWSITFEYNFLREGLRRTGLRDSMDYHRIDIPSIAWSKFPRIKKMSQDSIGELLGVAPEAKPHRAINGAEYAWGILRKLRGL